MVLLAGSRLFNNNTLPNSNNDNPSMLTPVVTSGSSLTIATNTLRPTIFLATVTDGPPTASATYTPTITPTEGPCEQQVQPNDDLISILYRCGHRTIDNILPTVLELNDLSDPSQLQAGQIIQVPWPTPTVDPNAIPTATIEAGVEGGSETVVVADGAARPEGGIRPIPTATLQPGVMWHQVQKDENIIQIAVNYGATLRILSELNPEVTFSQCDFGLGTGGANCIVQLYEGQRIRVPAPTPMPTIPPTPSGSETPTPTATPTFNAPNVLGPSDRAFFRKDEFVTLRWVATGSLGSGQSYLIRVRDINNGTEYTGMTQELYFIVPQEWRSQTAERHDYSWTVSVIDDERPDSPYFTTEARRFTWQGNS
ncbi:MAG: LysM peptidoglycan-binding domain-containing protein [Anaerolineae bacterium]|nr:LysM peptidoglycan-binding domain-containing protein [Anaerolineae bacterium]